MQNAIPGLSATTLSPLLPQPLSSSVSHAHLPWFIWHLFCGVSGAADSCAFCYRTPWSFPCTALLVSFQECLWPGPGTSGTLSHCLTYPFYSAPLASGQARPSPAVCCSGFFIADRDGTVGQHQAACLHALEKGPAMVYLGAGPLLCVAVPGFPSQPTWWICRQPRPRLVGGCLESSSLRTRQPRWVAVGRLNEVSPPLLECLSLLGGFPTAQPSPVSRMVTEELGAVLQKGLLPPSSHG